MPASSMRLAVSCELNEKDCVRVVCVFKVTVIHTSLFSVLKLIHAFYGTLLTPEIISCRPWATSNALLGSHSTFHL